jgi:hypothetical protein
VTQWRRREIRTHSVLVGKPGRKGTTRKTWTNVGGCVGWILEKQDGVVRNWIDPNGAFVKTVMNLRIT